MLKFGPGYKSDNYWEMATTQTRFLQKLQVQSESPQNTNWTKNMFSKNCIDPRERKNQITIYTNRNGNQTCVMTWLRPDRDLCKIQKIIRTAHLHKWGPSNDQVYFPQQQNLTRIVQMQELNTL